MRTRCPDLTNFVFAKPYPTVACQYRALCDVYFAVVWCQSEALVMNEGRG